MTVDSKLPAADAAVGGAERDSGDATGLLLGRLTALPALVLFPLLLAGFPLLLAHYFKPVPVLVLWAALTVAIVPYAWRRIPPVTHLSLSGGRVGDQARPTPRWALWSLVAVAVAFGVFQGVFHSQQVIVQLDAASYMQYANWISAHGTTVIPVNAQDFGGHPASILYWSAAFFQTSPTSNVVVPQFMAGLPMVLSTGFWAGGMRVALLWGPVLGALAVFTFGGLVARLVGPRWAPFAAAALGIGIPMAFVSRSTWSEPLALILLVGGLSLWVDSQRTGSRVLAGAAGLLLGITFLVRVDGPADIMFIIPFAGLLILRRHRQVYPLLAGLAIGILYGAVDGVFVTLPYLETNKQSVEGMAAGVVLLLIVTVVAVAWLRLRGSEFRFAQLRESRRRKLANALTALPFVVVALFAIYPYTVRSHWAALQYAPLSLHWIYWYAGLTTIVFAVIGYAMIGRRAIQGKTPDWVLPLLVFGCATLVFLLRPGITPHQPLASRRLVPAVLPGLTLVATWLVAWLSEKSRALHLVDVPPWAKRAPRVVVTIICAAGIFLPPLFGNFGLGLKGTDGLALVRTYAGEVSTMDKLCAAIPKDTSVLVIDHTMWWAFGQDIRGMCHVPVAGVQTTPAEVFPFDGGTTSDPGTVIKAVQAIMASGHTPFVIAPTQQEFAPLVKAFGGAANQKFIMSVTTGIDEHNTFGAPHNAVTQLFTAYSWEPAK
jgi:hypothetical protein